MSSEHEVLYAVDIAIDPGLPTLCDVWGIVIPPSRHRSGAYRCRGWE